MNDGNVTSHGLNHFAAPYDSAHRRAQFVNYQSACEGKPAVILFLFEHDLKAAITFGHIFKVNKKLTKDIH